MSRAYKRSRPTREALEKEIRRADRFPLARNFALWMVRTLYHLPASERTLARGAVETVMRLHLRKHPMRGWLMDQPGITATIAAAVTELVVLHRAPSAEELCSYAGLTPGTLVSALDHNRACPYNPLLREVMLDWTDGNVSMARRFLEAYHGKLKQEETTRGQHHQAHSH